MIRLTEEQTRCHITRDEREVGTVVTIEHLFRTGSTHNGHKRVVVIGVTTIEPVCHTVDLVLADDIREVDMGIVHGDAEVQYHVHTSPVTQPDGYAIGILRIKALDILLVFLHIRA